MRMPQRYVACSIMLPAVQRTAPWTLAVVVLLCFSAVPVQSHNDKVARSRTTPTPPLHSQGANQLMDAAGIGATSLAAAAAAAAEFVEGSQESPNDGPIAITDNHNHSEQQTEAILLGEDAEQAEGSHLLASDHPMIVNGANLLLDTSQRFGSPLASGATAHSSVNLTRHHDGDLFRTSGVTNCNMDTCVGLSSGTAGLVRLGAHNGQEGRIVGGSLAGGSGHSELGGKRHGASSGVGETCECGCFPYLRTYREDLGICVDDIHECTLSPFVSGSSSEKIPFVFLPLRGQIIYPSREIRFSDIRTPVCAVTGAQYLTANGWSDLRNPIDTDYPFRIYRDEGRSFLQWLGDRDLRQKMQGRLIVVHLVCREMTIALNATAAKDQLKPPQNVFSPCVAFRVNGSPVKFTQNVSEVLFQSETTSTMASTSEGMTTKEYVVICLCSLLLGLIYVASVFLYLHMKKRKGRDRNSAHMRNSLNDLENEINYPKNDQVTFGAPFNRSGSLYSANSMGTSNEPRSRNSIGTLKEEMGIVKNNPLLQHFPQLSDHHSGFASDISNSNSECEMDGPVGNSLAGSMNAFHEKLKQMQTAALVHPQLGASSNGGNGSPQGREQSANSHNQTNANDDDAIESASTQSQETECLPAENCSIVEDVMTEEKLENLRAMLNGTIRKKLYFNPAYFEPHLLAHPPPAAVEFLQKIREVIAIAKYKMAMKRYEPSLIVIPEEGSTGSNISAAQLPTTAGDCGDSHSKRSGEKRNSIEKWLKSVSETDQQATNGEAESASNRPQPGPAEDGEASSRGEPPTSGASTSHPKSCSPAGRPNVSRKEITPPKERPPPPPVPAKPTAKEDNTPDKGRKQLAAASASTATQQFATNVTTIPISRQYEAFSSLSMAANMYGFAEMGSEIYNNPKFNLHDSPAASMRSRGSSHHSKSSRKRLDVLDQYAAASTPTSLTSAERQHYDMLRNMKQMPDHLYDSLGRESNNGNYHLDIPTPDYDSTIEKKIKDIYNSTQSSAPSVPTPDYSTLSRKSLKQGQQPDSPIYRRKSPQYLIVDYETDSLERMETTKRKSSQSSSSPSSDVSSQLSPSLSTALPLEEELEISHAVYDKVNGFRKEGDRTKKLTGGKSDRNASKHKEIAARIKYDTPFLGSMTIEVEHEPPSDMEPSTDSEQFDPDTLDRSQRQRSFCDVKSWTQQGKLVPGGGQPASHIQPGVHTSAAYSSAAYMLKANHSFRSQSSTRSSTDETRVSFSSLRELYQSQMSRPNGPKNCKCGGQASLYMAQHPDRLTEQGRLLTLEAKHSRRQRVTEPPKTPSPPPVVQISNVPPNKTTIKITTPKVSRASTAVVHTTDSATSEAHSRNNSFRGDGHTFKRTPSISSTHITPPSTIERLAAKKAAPPPPPPSLTVSIVSQPGPASLPTSNSTATATTSTSSGQYSQHGHEHHTYQNQRQYGKQSPGNPAEEETMSNHSQSTEVTGVSDTVPNSDLEGSRQNTLTSCNAKLEFGKGDFPEYKNQVHSEDGKNYETSKSGKKFPPESPDYGAMFNTKINGLRGDYSLTKYMHRRKLSEPEDKLDSHSESDHNNGKSAVEPDAPRADVLSLGSRSNQSSSRLSDRTKEMYRNAGVPVGIAYPQRSVAASSNTASNGAASNSGSPSAAAVPVQTVYRCEIEPVQLTHGMQIAMGLKDRAKKAKDLKNAWKKFVSLAASKFSPTQSPAPPFEKKLPGFLEGLDRDDGISSLIDENARVSTPKSSYSAPASQNYYEQRFGARPQEMDSGYMSADSGEVYKRSFYDRYNFKMMTERDHIIRVDTIEDNSDGGSTLTDRHNGVSPSGRRGSILDSNRFEDLENIGEPPPNEIRHQPVTSDDNSDGDSDRTVTRRGRRSGHAVYSSEDEQGLSTSYGSSETDGETNADDMWESGAESIETHSVLYKQVRKS